MTEIGEIADTAGSAGPATRAPALRELRTILALLRRTPGAAIALLVLVLLVICAVFARQIAPYDPQHSYYDAMLQGPSWRFPFGTDPLGRDMLSRVIYGAQISLRVGLTTTAFALGLGVVLALAASMGPRLLDSIILRIMDMLLAFPSFLLALAMVAVLGPGLDNALFAVAISLVPGYVRTVRSLSLGIRSRDFIDAARILGGSPVYIALRHVLPNILGGIIVLATLGIALVTLEVAALSFVGLGARPPTPEWGSMLAESRAYLDTAWWLAAFPGLAITITVLSINVVGDWLRDLLDPRSRR